jgi:hypothetical protein
MPDERKQKDYRSFFAKLQFSTWVANLKQLLLEYLAAGRSELQIDLSQAN